MWLCSFASERNRFPDTRRPDKQEGAAAYRHYTHAPSDRPEALAAAGEEPGNERKSVHFTRELCPDAEPAVESPYVMTK